MPSQPLPATYTPVIDLALDTIAKQKQALVFVNARRSAEKEAEEIAKKSHLSGEVYEQLEKDVLSCLATPTKQCKRLAFCIKRGIAFHHAGLHTKQKEIVEDAFRSGEIKIICATPTLAAGLDLPAFRTIIRDTKRFTFRGYEPIPVLEYHQMAGRAGRPSYDTEGQAICIAASEGEKEDLLHTYLHGKPEEIFSKLAAEPVLRTYVLSLIATKRCNSRQQLMDFFSKTFFAHQFKNMDHVEQLVEKVLHLLQEWEFLEQKQDDFMSADEINKDGFKATRLGQRVSELYLDPYTAHQLMERLQRKDSASDLAYLQAISNTLEMRPLLRIKKKDVENVEQQLLQASDDLLDEEPSYYDEEYDQFLQSVQTALFFNNWINEKHEDFLLENFNIAPGEIKVKLDIIDWLIYAATELGKVLLLPHSAPLMKLRLRLQYGIKEELLPLVKIKGIGKVRARKLFDAGVKDIRGLNTLPLIKLQNLVGEKTAMQIKNQLAMN